VICLFFYEKSPKGDSASKIWQKRSVFKKQIAKIETVLKLFEESVATGLPVGDSSGRQF
jgi:hypothetical protein